MKTKIWIIAFLILMAAGAMDLVASTANVAVVPYVNRTGSAQYDWIRNSLPDAVYSSMGRNFEFTRTDNKKITSVLDSLGAEGFLPDRKHLALVAEKTGSDIVISGWYTFDKQKNLVTITTHVYHASRYAITSQIQNETPVSNRMFQVIDVVSGRIVDHIKQVAMEDIERFNRLASDDQKIDTSKGGKLVLHRAGDLSPLKPINFNAAIGAGMPTGPLFDVFGPILEANIYVATTYRSLFVWGGGVLFKQFIPHKDALVANPGMSSMELSMYAALNFNIQDQVFIQPFLATGGAFQLVAVKTMVPTMSGNTTVPRFEYAFDYLITGGVRVPIRLPFTDNFIVPYASFTWYPLHFHFEEIYLYAHVSVGVGIGF